MMIRGAGKSVQVEGVAECPPVDLQLLLPWYLVDVPFNRLGCCSIPGGGSQVSQLVRRRARNLLYHPFIPRCPAPATSAYGSPSISVSVNRKRKGSRRVNCEDGVI